MTTATENPPTALDRIAQPRALADVSNATAIEQSRAIAEVQAAVIVAQNVPRDMDRAIGDMRDSCGRTALANRAFYSVPNRGSGPSVHLARELARIWGNLQYGVHELRRDDEQGLSEVQAFAWDVQTNVRSTRTFQVPHERMKNKRREKLIDLGDVYLNNQNVGARAVRECIFTVLPTWFTEEAQDLCNRTIRDGDGEPLSERIAKMVKAFGDLGVTQGALEDRLGRKRGQWTAGEVAQATVIYTSLSRGEVKIEDEFAAVETPGRVTVDEITAPPVAPPVAPDEDPDADYVRAVTGDGA